MDIYIDMGTRHDDYIRISFTQVRFVYDTSSCSLLKAFEYYMQSRFQLNIYNSKIVGLHIRLNTRYFYTFPTYTKPTIDYDKVLDECNQMWDMLNHPHMSIPECYINICTHMRDILTMEEFDKYNGGEALIEDCNKELTAPDLYTGIRYIINR